MSDEEEPMDDMDEEEILERIRECEERLRESGPQWQWAGRLPSGLHGIHSIEMTLELMLHVRMYTPEHFGALVAAAHELCKQSKELLDEIVDGRDLIHGFEAQEANRAQSNRGRWEDLLFVLGEYGALEETPAA